LSEKQTPQPVENTENPMEILEPKEANIRLHTQEVRGSSPCVPSIVFIGLQGAVSSNSGLLLFGQVVAEVLRDQAP
jgi:hypothetical protein